MAATDRYLRAAGGSYSAAASWENTAGGGETVTVPTSANDVFLVAGSGQLTVDTGAAAGKSLDCTGYTNTLTHLYTWTLYGDIKFVAGMTYTPSVGALLGFNPNTTLTTAGKLMPSILNTNVLMLDDNLTFMDSKTITFSMGSPTGINLNGKTMSGYSATSRILIQSSVLGTPRTITVAGGTFANCDFKDIQFANGGSNLDLSAITGLSGDCGGNAMSGGGALTLTTASTQTWDGATGNTSNAAHWTSHVPLPQDLPVLAGTNTVTVDMPRIGKDISFTAATPLTLGNSVTSYGSVDFTNSGILSGSQIWTFESQSRSGTCYVTSAGKVFPSSIIQQTFGATLQLADAMTWSGASYTLNNGVFVDAGFSYAGSALSSAGSAVRSITKTGNWVLNRSTAGNVINIVATGLTWSDTAGSITISDTGASAKTFAGGGLTYNNLIIAGGGSGAVSITGANTFKDFSVGYPKQVIFQHGVQQTFTNPPVFAGIDNPTKIINGSTLNGDMENWISDTNAANWVETIAGTSTITKDAAVFNSGLYSAKFVVDASNNMVSINLSSSLTIGKRYKVIFYGKGDGGAFVYVSVGDGGSAVIIPTLPNVWTKYTGYITSATTTFTIKRTSASQTFWVDDVTLEESTAIELSSDLAGSPATLSCPGKFNYLNWCSVKDIVGKSGEMWVAVNSTNVVGNSGILFDPVSFPLSFFHVGMDGGFGG